MTGRRTMLLAAALSALMWRPAPAAAGAAAGIDWDAVSKEAVALLQQYVRIRSVNPPADTTATAAFLKGVLEKEGIAVTLYPSAPGKVNLLARLPATAPASPPRGPVMLMHHMDVVPVDPARWPVDPFGAVIRDGFLHGRGSADMKGLGVIHLMALLTLHRQHVPLDRDILLLATADEESGGQDGARWMIANHWEAMRPEYVFDEGGFGSRDVMAADGRLVFTVSVTEKKILWAKLVSRGTAGHGSQPIADNANDALVRALSALLGMEVPPDAQRPAGRAAAVVAALRERVGDLAANKFTRAIQRDTLSLTTLRSGVGDPPKVNVIPSAAEATIDCRLLPDTDIDRYLAALNARLRDEPGVTLEVTSRIDDVPVTPWDTPLFAIIEKAIRAEHPGAVVTPAIIPYGTDSNAFRQKGAGAYGLTPMVVDASIVASMHSDDERVPVDQLVRGVRIFHEILREYCGR